MDGSSGTAPAEIENEPAAVTEDGGKETYRQPGILSYLERLAFHKNVPATKMDAPRARHSGGLAATARNLVPEGMRPSIKAAATALARPHQRFQARRLTSHTGNLGLHLGSGPNHLSGWVNVDLAGLKPDLAWDLRHPLPFHEGSVGAIFHEHLLEHLNWWEAVALLRECWRLLRPAGILRLGVPDFGRFACDYCSGGSLLESERPGRPTSLLALAEIAYSHHHRSMWDEETLVSLLDELGFADARARNFGDSGLDPVPDSSRRRQETLYVETVKP